MTHLLAHCPNAQIIVVEVDSFDGPTLVYRKSHI